MRHRFFLLLPVLFVAGSALAADFPDMKAGLWSNSVSMGQSGQPPRTGQMCTNNGVTKAMADMSRGPNSPCKTLKENHSGSVYTVQTQCTFNNQSRTTTSVTTVSGNTGMHTEVSSDDGTLHIVTDSKYVGACPAGMTPGDYVDGNGMKFNMLKGAPPAPPPPQNGAPQAAQAPPAPAAPQR